jgi:hypothetical protein
LRLPALVLEELDPSGRTPSPTEWGDTLDEVPARVVRPVQQGTAGEQVPVAVAGKLAGPWPAQATAPGGPANAGDA